MDGQPEPMSDAELVALCQQGDLRAFNSLVRKWDAGLYHFVRRMMGDAEEARDIVQETLLKAHLNIRRLRDPESFRSWIHHIAINLCRDWHRSPRVRKQTRSLDAAAENGVELAATGAATDAGAERSSTATLLEDVLARLSHEQRTAILLREYHGFTSDEIARITGVPAATVRTRIFYGLRAVRKLLAEQGIVSSDLEPRAPDPLTGKRWVR